MSALEASLVSDLDHARECRDHVRSTLNRLDTVYDKELVNDTIRLAREALALSQKEDEDHLDACLLLASSLDRYIWYEEDDVMLKEAMDLRRQALALCHQPDRSDRGTCCGNLAASLLAHYKRIGDHNLLEEAIALQREALSLSPKGHPSRYWSCGNLAVCLQACYERTGDDHFLDEAIDLRREVYDLHPTGHPDRGISCGDLAGSLKTRYDRTGDDSLLNAVIELQRELLSLHLPGHPNRAESCGNLAVSLRTRYTCTGDDRLLAEAIDLERHALTLRPEGHSHRAMSCGNLAIYLTLRYDWNGDHLLLDEAVELQRAAHALRPRGHPQHIASCANLSFSLIKIYDRTGDDCVLDEVISVEREAFHSCPKGHPHRDISCGNLATSLRKRYMRTHDFSLLREIFNIRREGAAIAPRHVVWRHLCGLSWLHLQPSSSFYDVSEAISCLSQSLEVDSDEVNSALQMTLARLDDIWAHDANNKHTQLVSIYQRLSDLMPLLVNPVLEMLPQLHSLKLCTGLGSDAFVNAALAGSSQLSIGLETLETAQGIIWSQILHRRDPQVQDVPKSLATELEDCIQTLTTRSTSRSYDQSQFALTSRDILHKHSSRAYGLMREIRALPGLDRFMLGEKYETLLTVGTAHPVVVLVGARGHFYALIVASSFAQGYELVSLDIPDNDLSNPFSNNVSRPHRGAESLSDLQPVVERLSLGKHVSVRSDPIYQHFKALWNKVVKPVLDCLGFKVSQRSLG
jgi:hypothetical protein